MKQVSEMNQAELGAYVQAQLRRKGIDAVLSGGAAVAIYTSGRYVTHDIDLVNRHRVSHALIKAVMLDLGFSQQGRHFLHPETHYIVEFPPGPLSVGDEEIEKIEEVTFETGTLRVISPTDSVKDRLAWFYHFGDRQCLLQAVMITRQHQVDIDNVGKWSKSEGKSKEFKVFQKQLQE